MDLQILHNYIMNVYYGQTRGGIRTLNSRDRKQSQLQAVPTGLSYGDILAFNPLLLVSRNTNHILTTGTNTTVLC